MRSNLNLRQTRRRWKVELFYSFILRTLILTTYCAPFCAFTKANSSETTATAAAADSSEQNSNIEGGLYPGLFHHLAHLPPSMKSTEEEIIPIRVTDRSWFGLVHGLPMMFVRPSSDLSVELRTTLKEWLLTDRAPVWKDLPQNPRWTGPDKTSLASKYTRYNLLQEALYSNHPRISAIGRQLRRFLGESLVEFTTLYPRAIEAMHHQADRAVWQARLGRVDPTANHHRFGPFPVGVHVQSWMNSHQRTTTTNTTDDDNTQQQQQQYTQSLHIHTHSATWHAFMPLDAAGTNTTIIVPPYHRRQNTAKDGTPAAAGGGGGRSASVAFNIQNSDGVLVMLCGGVRHGVPPVSMGSSHNNNNNNNGGDGEKDTQRERVSVAFDFIYSATINGNTEVTHPGATSGMLDPVWPSSSPTTTTSSSKKQKIMINPQLLHGPENVNTLLLTPAQLEQEMMRALQRRHKERKGGVGVGGVGGEFIMEPLALDAQSVEDMYYPQEDLKSLDFASVLDMKKLVGDAPIIHNRDDEL